MTDKKIDFRKADKAELLALSRLLMNLQSSLSPVGYKITVKKSASKPKTNQTEQKFTSIS
jgi:hypothetical protein